MQYYLITCAGNLPFAAPHSFLYKPLFPESKPYMIGAWVDYHGRVQSVTPLFI